MPPLLDRGLRHAGHGVSVLHHAGGVADDEDVRVPRKMQARLDAGPARAVGLRLEHGDETRGLHAGGPQHRRAFDAFAAREHALGVDRVHARTGADLDAERLQPLDRPACQRLVERSQRARPRLDQDDARIGGVDAAEVALQRDACHLGHRCGKLDAGRAGADQHERHRATALGDIVRLLGALVGRQDAGTDGFGVRKRLEARRVGGEIIVPEVAWPARRWPPPGSRRGSCAAPCRRA